MSPLQPYLGINKDGHYKLYVATDLSELSSMHARDGFHISIIDTQTNNVTEERAIQALQEAHKLYNPTKKK